MNLIKWVTLACIGAFSFKSVQAQSFTIDQEIGSEGATQIANTIGIYQDSNITAYVNVIGKRLVKYLGEQPFDYHFYVLDMAEPNAFALPGGYVYVSRGILALANSEDELAGVISHEIMHVHKRHGIQQAKSNIFPNIIQLPGAVIGTVINEELGQIINAPAAFSSSLLLSNYSRAHETEADELGAELMAAAGYNPAALPRILDHLHQEVEAITGEEESFSYFDSHPYTPNRVSNLEKRIKNGKVKVPEVDKSFIQSTDYKNLLSDMPLDQNPQAGMFVGNDFIHPEIDFFIQLPNGWQRTNQPIALIAADTTSKAQIAIQAIPDTLSPVDYGRRAKKMMWEKRSLKAEQSQLVTLDGQPGYLLKYVESTEMGEVIAYTFWWKSPKNVVIRTVGLGLKSHDDVIWNTIQTIGSIPDSTQVSYTVLEVEQAKQGEQLSDIVARRKDNVLSMSVLSAINGEPFNHVFETGKLVKLGVKKKIQF